MVQKIHLNISLDINDDEIIRPLCIKLNQLIGYAKYFDANMTFKVDDNKLLKKYNKICEKVSNLMNIEFDCGSVYGDRDKNKNVWR